jgi:hypothetical protein
MDPHLQKHVRADLLEALALARSAALVVGSTQCTQTYRAAALGVIFDRLAFAVPHVLHTFDPKEDISPLCETTSMAARVMIQTVDL